MDAIPWFAWIPLLAIAIWGITEIIKAFTSPRGEDNKKYADALRSHTEATTAVIERLDGIERRLATIEKTLTDIP